MLHSTPLITHAPPQVGVQLWRYWFGFYVGLVIPHGKISDQIVRLGSHSSNPTPCLVGVPQGSVLGPLLFIIYSSPISHIAEAHNIQQHQYADDTQLFVALTSNNVHAHVSTLESCLSSPQAWFCANSMILNPVKSNSILFVTTQRVQMLPNQISINISDVSIPLSNHVKILCSTHVSLYLNIPRLSRNPVLSHSCPIRHIRSSLDHLTIRI